MIFINFGYPMGTANENLLFHRLTPLLPPPSAAKWPRRQAGTHAEQGVSELVRAFITTNSKIHI